MAALGLDQAVDVGRLAVGGHDDRLHADGVGVGELHALLALLGDGHASGGEVVGMGGQRGNDGAEVDVDDLQVVADLLADGLGDLDVDAGGLARFVVVELIGREVDVGGQGQGAVLGQRGKAGKQEHRDDDQ